ncbi:MAG: hypothetical protein IJ507_09285 [Clostridia bacterium]|nr:hypothetical protein [Clostridia bacterium]
MRTATVFNFLVEATLIGSLLILAALVLRALIRRELGSRRLMILWVLVAMRLLLPIALPNPVMNWLKPNLSQDAGIRPMADQVRVRVGDAAHNLYWKALGEDTDKSIIHSLIWRLVYATRSGRLSRTALIIYLSGAMLTLAGSIGCNALFILQIRRRRRHKLPPEYRDVFLQLCTRRRLKHPPRVWMVEGLPGSCSFDLMRPVIALPLHASAEDVPAMLDRELCHIRCGDRFWAVVRSACCILHWFNPLVWLAAFLSRTDQCLACDEYALRGADDNARRLYASPLIHTAETHRAQPAVTVASSPAALRDRQLALRIRMILHPEKPSRCTCAVYLVCCALAAAGMFATAEQSSLANLPALTSPALRQQSVSLSDADTARQYAAAFLALEGIDADDGFVEPALMKSSAGWTVEWYVPGAELTSQLIFTEEGEILGYVSGDVIPGNLRPLARPITTHNGEGQQWCAFLSGFIEIHMPELWSRYEAMEIVSSGRSDGEQYITISLLDAQREPCWQAVVQVAPAGRVISLLPIVG